MTKNFAQAIRAENKAGLLYLINAQAEGKDSWYYLQVDAPKHNAFKQKLETGSLDLADYGTVLYSGWGTTPPDMIQSLIAERFEGAA